MAAQYKTRCPHCEAQFKISQEHLKQAGGQVRCGSCLEIFQATEHLIRESAPKTPARQPAPKPAQKTPAKKPVARKPKPQKKPADDEPQWQLPGAEEEPADSGKQKGKPKQKDPFLEENDTAVSLGDSELSDSFLTLGEEADDFGAEDFSDMSGAAGGGESGSDESWAEKLLEDLEGGEEPHESEREPVTPDNMSLLDEFDGSDEDIEYEERGEAAEGEDLDFLRDDFGDLGDGGEPPGEIESIEIPEARERKPKIPRPAAEPTSSSPMELLKWGGLSLAAALVLGVQYLVFNFSELARTPEWRPFYAQVCGLLPCDLPNPSDVSSLRGANLVVREHPSVEDALVVDAILFNEADYPQPFPVLELSFSTLNGRPVAARRFAPSEYRNGELEQLEKMPPEVPIHISLEIRDPGEQAVNYNLQFYPAPATSG